MIKAVIFDAGGVLFNTASSLDLEVYKKEIKTHVDVVDFANSLKEKGLKIGVLSNTIPGHINITRPMHVFDGFDELIFSYEVGLEKPDPKIYQLALDRLGIKAEEAIFIDDKSMYVDAAKAVGINGIVFTNLNQLKSDLNNLILI
jgi:putative hydrolase of the HAD superfamily